MWQFFVNHPPLAGSRRRYTSLTLAAALFFPAIAYAQCPPEPGGPPSCTAPGPASPASNAGTDLAVGNPLNVITGNKYQREDDMPALPGVLGLELVRHYNSASSGPQFPGGLLGRGWRLSYETRLVVLGNTIQILQADGARLIFNRNPGNPSLCSTGDPANGSITVGKGGAGGEEFSWTWTNGRTLSFDAAGKLLQIRAPSGEFVSLQYDQLGVLVKVIDPQGRSLTMSYPDRKAVGADGRYGGVRAIDSPVGRFRYEYGSMPPPKHTLADPRVLWASLVAVHYPAEAASVAAPGVAASRLYHYENPRFPTLLTGISLAGGGPIRRYATYGYDEAGLAVLSTHANGAGKVTLAFPKAGTTLLTNALGQQTVYRHALVAGMQRLLEVRGPGCATCGETNVRYDYDKLGRLTTTTQLDVAGKPLKASALVLDAVGRIVTVSDIAYAGGKPGQARLQVRYAYQGTGPEPLLIARPSVVEGREAQRLLSYNDAGQLTGVTEQGWAPAVHGPPQPITRRTAYTYALVNGRSVLTQIDGPLPNGAANSPADSDVTRFTYDASGNFPTRIVEPGNRVTDIAARDTAGRATEVASSDGVRLLQTRAAYLRTGQAATLRYGGWLLGADKKALANSARSRVFRYEVDAHGRMLGRSAPGDITLRYQYDAAGNTTHTVAADGSQTVSRYDLENRLTALTQFGPGAVAASLQRFEYDSGRLSRSDVSVLGGPAGASLSSVSYATRQGALAPSIYGTPAASMPDAPAGTGLRHGQVASVAQGLVEQVTRADGSVIRRWVDDFGRVTAIDGGERGLQQARYTGDDQLSRLEDARGAVTLFERDSLGRLTQVHGEGAEPERVLFRFEGAVLAQQTRWKGNVLDSTIEWQHDVWGNPVGKRLIIAARTGQAHAISLAVANSVDEALRQSEKTLPSGALLRYRADRAGRVTSILLNGKPLVSAIGHAFHADAVVPVRFMYGNGLLSETTYDVNGHLATHASGIERRRFVTDAEGRITTIARQPVESGNPVRQAAAPGWFDWISAANAQAVAAPAGAAGVAAQRYAYDASGRLVSERGPGNSRPDLAYDKIGNRLGGPPALLDAAGNVLRLRGQQFIYSRFGELSEARAANGDVRASYRYDPDGIRYAKEVNGATSYFLYEDDQLIAEADAAGRIVSEYIYLGKRPVARLRHVPAEGVLASLKGASSVVEYLHTDQRGALEGITDGDRKIVWRARLSAFGEAAVVKGKAGAMPLRLAGQYADPETGLYYNVHRYYDPASGRYTQADPIGIAAGLNLFAYAESDPLGKSDSTGLNIDPDDPPTVSRPWLFGTFVHGMFANQVRAYGTGWGANDTRMNPKPTWPGVRPDAYYVDPMNLRLERDKLPFVGSLWELKPISWSSAINPSKYAAAKAEVAFYISSARPGGCWSAGASSAMAGLKADTLIYDKKLWMINYVPDATNTGLVFYTKTAAPQKPEPATVPAPSLSESEKAELERSLQELKLEGEREGWSKLAKIGMVVLIGIAIAALLFVALRAAAVLAAILATFKLVLAAARAGTATLMAGLSAMLGLNPTTVAAQAEVKGDEKEKGLLDGTIAWFKSWF